MEDLKEFLHEAIADFQKSSLAERFLAPVCVVVFFGILFVALSYEREVMNWF